ncbi:uncharacterized protein FIESC28_08771 [Fusarium coffeatum]|uniref:Xylanolytic transcriptional activator regulatory domain-containing protein n=1 Tax=Fusarium coffeatum TaxID=231269 RepID=A0A366R4Q3_9HYPO|nr:uncharacterized protein FIESC28_08771 [Fusarium coffeatum]RBR12137.1 hypothetical protein FIESC28_08771 [Fusarium coffeatum]
MESPMMPQDLPAAIPAASPLGTSPSSVSYGQIHFGGCHFGHFSQHNGMPLLSEEGKQWIASKTGEEVLFEPVPQPTHMTPPTLPAEYFRDSKDLWALPDRAVVETVFDVFANSSFSLVFPVVDRVLFQSVIDLAYSSLPVEVSPLEHMSCKACVLAFLSIIPLFKASLLGLPAVDTDLCAAKARYILTDVLEEASLTTLQVAFMLNMHEIFLGRLRSASMFHAIACRTVFALGGQNYIAPKPHEGPLTHSERGRRQIRLLFWLTYIFDKDIALRTGQPPLMSDDYCDLTLPENYLNCYEYLPGLSHSLSPELSGDNGLTPHLPGDPRLSHIKEKTSRLLYSAQAAKKTPAQLLFDIRDLDHELENWRLSIPSTFRPQLSISNESQVTVEGMQLPRSMRAITLHLEYHHLMTTIHRASGRCMQRPEADGPMDEAGWASTVESGVESSIALALEASRSTLVYLKAALNGLAGEAFWIVVFYPTAAMITIFFNILMHPLHGRAVADLELLRSAANLICELPISRLTSREVAHTKLVNEFATELVRLAKSAIARAK